MRKYFSNILIVCGSGRNVGKTTFVCSVINKISKNNSIAAVKISPHFHMNTKINQLVIKEKGYNIYTENQIQSKDSSLFYQAGADPVYYIETLDSCLEEAFYSVLQLIGNNKLIIIESGHLGKIIKPAFLIYLETDKSIAPEPKKHNMKEFADLTLNIIDKENPEVYNKIVVENNNWHIKHEPKV